MRRRLLQLAALLPLTWTALLAAQTAATQADLGPGFDCAPMPPLLVKGKSQPLAVFIVRWMGAA